MRPIDFFLKHATFLKPFEARRTGTCYKCHKTNTPLALSEVCVECGVFTIGYPSSGRISWGAVIVQENKITRACFGTEESKCYEGLVEMIPQPYGNPLACAVADLISNPVSAPFILATFSRNMDDAVPATTQICYPGEKLYVSGAGFRVSEKIGGARVDGGSIRSFDLERIKKLMNRNIAPAMMANIVESRYFQDTAFRRKIAEEYREVEGLPAYNTPEYFLLSSMQQKKTKK